MVVSKAAKRYAKAFFEIAQEKGSLEVVAEDFAGISTAIEASEELVNFLKAPLISSEKRVEVLNALFSGKVNSLTLELLLFLERKGRLNVTQQTLGEFAVLHDQFKNVQRISITSAFTMADAQVEAIKKRLSEKLNKNIEADVAVDASLIGGFKIKVGDQVHDLSVVTQLNKVRQSIVKA